MAYACKVPARLYDAIPCGIAHFTPGDPPRIAFVNEKGCSILGYKDKGELMAAMGDNAFAHILPPDLPLAKRVVRKLCAGRLTFDFHHRFRRADGTLGWMRGTAALVEEGESPVLQAAFNDVTREHETWNARTRDRYVSVLCSAFSEVYEIDTESDTCRLLRSSVRAEGADEVAPIADALEKWGNMMVGEGDRDLLMAVASRFSRGEWVEPIVLTFRMALETRTIWCQSTFLRMDERSFLCCNNDVSERMRHEDEAVSRAVGDVVARLPVGIGVYAMREDGLYPLYVSDQVCDMFGYTNEEYAERAAKGVPTFAEQDLRAILDATDPQSLRSQGVMADVDMARKDGTPLTVRIRGSVAQAPTGEYVLYAALLDVTEEERIRREASWQNERYRILSELTHAVSIDYDFESDTASLYLDAGNGMEAQVVPGYLENLESGRGGVIHPDSIGPMRDLFKRVSLGEQDHAVLDYQADYYGTGFRWFRANLFVADDEGGAWHLVGLIEDIQGERDLRRQAQLDLMTGVANHATTVRLISDALKDPLVRACSVAVVLDVDDFKNVNDRCGHLKGDELLIRIGELIAGSCRATDVVGRVGGDEFVMLLKGMTVEAALRKLDDVRAEVVALAESFSGLDKVSVSMGVYAVQPGDETYDDVVGKADKALYASKRGGKNRVTVHA